MTKQQALFKTIKGYELRIEYEAIYTIYDKPSYLKCKAWKELVEKMHKLRAYFCTLCGKNTSTFSISYLFNEGGKTYLTYETAYNSYVYELTEEEIKEFYGM